MDWLVLEELHDDGARLVALRLIDSERRVLFEGAQDAPLRAALHPSARAVAVDVRATDALKGRARSRVALVDVERLGQRWLQQSIDGRWQIGGLCFDDDGRHFALEGAYDGAPFPDIYVFGCDLRPGSFDERLVGGVRNPHGYACARPAFVPDDGRVIYLLQTRPDGGWVPAILDPRRTGAAETTPGDRAPGLHTAVLAASIDVVPGPGLLVDPEGTRAICVTRVRGGARQQLVAVPLDGRPPRPLGKSHGRIESPALSADGRRIAYAADGRVWMGLVGGEVQAVAGEAGGEHHRGLCFDADGETLYFVTHGPHGATVDACEVSAGVPYPIAQLGDVTVLDLIPLPADPRLALALDQRGAVDDKPTFIDGATSITRLPESDSLISPDTMVARIDGADPVADDLEDGTLAGGELTAEGLADELATGPPAADSLMTDPEGLSPDATAAHDLPDLAAAVPDPEQDDEATAAHPIIDLPSSPPAPSPPPVASSRPARLPSVARPAALPSIRRPAPLAPAPQLAPPRSSAPLPPARPIPGALPRPLGDDDERTVIEPPQRADAVNTVIEPPRLPQPRDTAIEPPPTPAAAPPPPPMPSAADEAEDEPDDSVLELSMSSFSSMDGDSPRADFEGWMAAVDQHPDPGARLAELERYAGDPRVGIAAVAWLEAQMERVATDGDTAVLGLIFAIAAVAHLRLEAARPQLRAMSRRAHDRLEMQRAIPEAEEHFALAALKAIDDAAVQFAAMTVYGEYQSIIEKIAGAMAEGGDVAERTRTLYLQLYRQRLSDALSPTSAEEVDTAAREALELAARQDLARERADAERAAIEAAERAAAEDAERRARAESARQAAAQVGAALAHRASVADDAMWARRRAEVESAGAGDDDWSRLKAQAEARAADDGPADDDWAQLKAQAEARASSSPVEDDRARQRAESEARARMEAEAAEAQRAEQAEALARQQAEAQARARAEETWARQRADAEARARMEQAAGMTPRPAEDDWARQRADAEARARMEQAAGMTPRASAEDDWARQRAEAEARARQPQPPQNRPTDAWGAPEVAGDPFNPLATASALPAQPIQAPIRPAVRDPRPMPAASNRPAAPRPNPSLDAFGPGPADFGQPEPSGFGSTGEAWGASAVSRISLGPPPVLLSAIGFGGVVAGVVLALLGVKIGAGFILFGLLWAVGGVALLGDKRTTWMLGIGAYLANALFLIGVGIAGEPPPWIAPAGLVVGGLAAAVVGGLLMLPVIRGRYRPGRPQF